MESKRVHFALVDNWRVISTYDRNFKTMTHFYTHITILSGLYDMAIKTHEGDFYIFMYRRGENGKD